MTRPGLQAPPSCGSRPDVACEDRLLGEVRPKERPARGQNTRVVRGSPPELVRFGERAGNHCKLGLSGWAAWVDVAVYVFWNRVRGGTSTQPGIGKQISVWVEVRDHTWTQRWGWGHRGAGSMYPQVAVSPFRISSIHVRLRDGAGKGVRGAARAELTGKQQRYCLIGLSKFYRDLKKFFTNYVSQSSKKDFDSSWSYNLWLFSPKQQKK